MPFIRFSFNTFEADQSQEYWVQLVDGYFKPSEYYSASIEEIISKNNIKDVVLYETDFKFQTSLSMFGFGNNYKFVDAPPPTEKSPKDAKGAFKLAYPIDDSETPQFVKVYNKFGEDLRWVGYDTIKKEYIER